MAFVRGHWRALGWVRSHWRSPQEPELDQLPLPADPPVAPPATPPAVIPIPRASAEAQAVRPVRR